MIRSGVRTSSLLVAVLAAALSATCGYEEAPRYDCSAEGRTELFEKRIRPLLEEDRPKSCNQCHLSGIDLSLFAKGDACQTMACLVQQRLVDLHDPEQSVILGWIGRADPESAGITEQVIAEEKAGFRQWIEQTAECGTCFEGENPCGDSTATVDDCAMHETKPETFESSDPGGCDDKSLETLFQNAFFPYRRRCFPCHFEGDTILPEAPKWIAVGPCEVASLTTYRQVIERGFLDVDAPDQSRWLLKPLDEALGGIEHGGGTKFHSKDEAAYQSMLYFSKRYADCKTEAP